MSDIIADLAAKCGVSADQAKKGLGAVLSFVKGSLPEESFNKVSAAVPESEEMMAAAGPIEESSGGIIGAIKDAAGKLFGGGSGVALISKLSNLGLSAEQAEKFIPQVMAFLKSKLPDSVMKQLSGLMPSLQETST